MKRPPRLGPLAVRTELGLLGFAPAMALLAIRTRHRWPWWLVFVVPAAFGFLVGVACLIVLVRAQPEPIEFGDIEDAGDQLLGNVGSYLLPVVIDTSKSTDQIVVAALALALIVQIHIVTGRVLVNPLLSLAGYRTYRAATRSASYYLIARTDPATWTSSHHCAPLGASILVEKRPRQRS